MVRQDTYELPRSSSQGVNHTQGAKGECSKDPGNLGPQVGTIQPTSSLQVLIKDIVSASTVCLHGATGGKID